MTSEAASAPGLSRSVSDGYGEWVPRNGAIRIRYREAALRELCACAAEGFAKIPRGGLEVGGILFGRMGAGEVTVEAWRPLDIEYKNGPTFTLTDTDRRHLKESLEPASHGAELDGLEAVGWWHSHTRSGLELSEADQQIHEEFFHDPAQIALLLRPEKLAPTRIMFFSRDENGALRTESGGEEFTLVPRRRESTGPIAPPEALPATLPATLQSEPHPLTEATEPSEISALPALRPDVLPPLQRGAPEYSSPRRTRRLSLAAAALLLVGTAAAGFFWWQQAQPPGEIGLRITGSGEVTLIEWDRSHPMVNGSLGADLQIRDGALPARFVHLDTEQVASGRVTYVRQSPEVSVRMRLYRQSGQVEFGANYIGPSPAQADTTAQLQPPATTSAQAEAPRTAQLLQAEAARQRTPELQQTAETQQQQRTSQPAPRALQLPPPSRQAVRLPEMAAVPPPTLSGAGPQSVESGPPISLLTGAPAAPERPKPATRPLQSGRAIWTGELRSGMTLTFDGGRPSFGVLSGRMPSGPAKVTVRTAELSDGGMIVFSPDPATRSREGSFESPSARNGWNLTTYKFDPRKASEVSVVEAPGAVNGWKRLRVAGSGRKVSVVIVDWQEIPPAK